MRNLRLGSGWKNLRNIMLIYYECEGVQSICGFWWKIHTSI